MDKAALYCRLSKEDDDKVRADDESESIMNQKLMLVDYAVKNGFNIEDIYVDEDFSGMDSDRPEFNRLLKNARLGRFNIVICKTQSRFSRDMEVIERYIHKEFQMLGIRFIGIVDNVDTKVKGNKKARQINSLINEWYIEDLSENIRAVYRKKMELGQFLGAFAPYGYKKSEKDKHVLEIDNEAAEVVKKIYKLYIEGYSIKQITFILEDENILPPTVYKRIKGFNYKNFNTKKYTQRYNMWSSTTVYRILTDTVYIGTLTQAKSTRLSYKSKKIVATPKENRVIIKNAHKPIIDDDTFKKVNFLLKNRGSVMKIDKKSSKVYSLAGKIRCFDCKSNLIKTGGSKNGDIFLRCQLSNKSRNKLCTGHYISLKRMEIYITEKIKEFISTVLIKYEKEISEKILKNFYMQKNKELVNDKEKDLLKECDIIRNTIKNLYLDKTKGIIDESEFIFLKNEFKIQEHKLKEKILNLKEKDNEKSKLIDTEKSLKMIFNEYINEITLNIERAEEFIEYIEVCEKDFNRCQRIIVYWNI